MKIRVQFYSRLKDIAGSDLVEWEVSEGTTVGELVQQLCERYPGLEQWRPHLLVAIGLDYATAETPLHEGAEVSIMPPVQGG